MANLLGIARGLWAGEDAATAAEYVLLAMLVAVACLTAVAALGSSLAGPYRDAADALK